MAFSKTLKDKKLRIQCDLCFREITLDPFIQCVDCPCDQCLVCFYSKIETDTHNSNHRYKVVSNVLKPLFSEEWRIIDELLLLNNIITFGIGNFEDIASVLYNKTEEDVRQHFFDLFNITDNKQDEVERTSITRSDPNDSSVLSYMSKRQDFESEIFNDYELMINSLQFDLEDDFLTEKLKKHMLYNYKVILKRRKIWRNFILSRNLTEVNKLKHKDTRELGQIASKYKWLAQYLTKRDFNKFIDGLYKEKKLKEKISNYKPEKCIDESKLRNKTNLLSKSELELCNFLNMSYNLYIKIKKLAIEFFVNNKPFKRFLYRIFDKADSNRVKILYQWFVSQNIIHLDEFEEYDFIR